MARRSLRPHFNQIRLWVQQGRTDAWIAHQLEVTVQQIESFKRENDLSTDAEGVEAPAGPAVDFDDEIDLRAEDDAQIAAELEAEAAAREAEEAKRAAEEAERKAAEEAARQARIEAGEDDDEDDDKPKRRRGRRGGRGRGRKSTGPYEGTFDHGDEGYGLWLDPAVADDGVYAEHWAGHRAIEVVVEADQIVIRRVGDGDEDDE